MSRITNPRVPRSSPTPAPTDPNRQILFIDEPTNEPILLPPNLLPGASKKSSASLLSAIAMITFFLFLISGSWLFGFLYARYLYQQPSAEAECTHMVAVTAQPLVDSPVVVPQSASTPATLSMTQPATIVASSAPVTLASVELPKEEKPKLEEKPKEEKAVKEKTPKEAKSKDPVKELLKEEKPKEPKEEKPKEVAGTLTKAQINATLKKAPLAACSVIGSGKVQLTILINSTGAVQSATGVGPLAICAAKRIQNMKFPAISAPSQTFTATAVVP
jgi:hypothetical protein